MQCVLPVMKHIVQLPMIPDRQRVDIIVNGLHFMRSITEAYGAEVGLKLWDTIANTLDQDVKAQIFLAMITGEYRNRIYFKGIDPNADTVACIRALRLWSGLGLKEAREICDRLKNPGIKEHITVQPENYATARDNLITVGFML